jgi:hypothetical protein
MTARASTTVAVVEPAAPPAAQPELRRAEPCTIVIFGAGDLLHRKLMPSLFHLMMDGLLPEDFAVITVAREPLDDGSFRARVRDALKTFLPNGAEFNSSAWERFAPKLYYISGELGDPGTMPDCRAATGVSFTSPSRRVSMRRPSAGWPSRASPHGCPIPSSVRGSGSSSRSRSAPA